MKILIIDDNQELVRLIKSVLELKGYQTAIACDGEDGLLQIKQDLPDMVILDLGLPKLTGEQVCKEIRKDKKTQDIPVVMLTGRASETDRVIGRVIGADYYLTKPCDLFELLEIAHAIRIRRNFAQ
ncbi:MAG: response regulator [Candidatus Omnitrophota bacterium]